MSPISPKASASSDGSERLPSGKDISESLHEVSSREGVLKYDKQARMNQGEDLSTDLHKDSTEATSQIDIRYTITCTDGAEMRSKQYTFTEEPFQELTAPEPEEPCPPMVIEVLMEAEGAGSSPAWKTEPLGSNVGPYTMTIAKGKGATTFRMAHTHSRNSDGDTTSGNTTSDEDNAGPGANHEDTFSASETVNKEASNNISDFGQFVPTSVKLKAIRIHSSNLVKLFRRVIQYYPGRSFAEDSILLEHPFLMLGHYYKELVNLRDGQLDTWSKIIHQDSPSEEMRAQLSSMAISSLDQTTIHDLNILLNYFKRHYTKNYEPQEAMFKNGYTSYTSLGFLFKPGTKVYARIGGKLAGFIFESGEEKKKNSQWIWQASCWCLAYDGRRIFRAPHNFGINKFRGDKQIVSLRVFPSTFLDSSDSGKTKSRLEDLGQKFYYILRDCPAHRYYEGPCLGMERSNQKQVDQHWVAKPDMEYSGEIIIDYRQEKDTERRSDNRTVVYPHPSPVSDGSNDENADSDDEDNDGPITLNAKAPWSMFHSINPKRQNELTKLHYFLLPRRMYGFALAKKQRIGFDVEYITEMKWPERESDHIGALIMDKSDKDVIKALTRKYARREQTWGADYMEGKGSGQIFLLHGPPGTGKTFTVECVAKSTRRPLLRLTVADIGTREDVMEDLLTKWFQRGADWGAVILIDEADVFLEKRQVKDLQRNSLVSVFLSCMEYYSGMLFLVRFLRFLVLPPDNKANSIRTTNRIGQIDDAFLSRISVSIAYPELDVAKQKSIWRGFLEKLDEEKKEISLTERAKKFLEGLDKDERTRNIPWNGREIRNALQTAIALATYDAEKDAEANGAPLGRILVRDEHFQAVVDRNKDFIDYRDKIRNKDEATRAFIEGSRALPQKMA